MEQSETLKVYNFNLSEYEKSNIGGIVINTIIFIVIYSIASIYIIDLLDKMPSYAFLSFIPLFILAMQLLEPLVTYLCANKIYKDDNITIQKDDQGIVSIQVQLRENRHNAYYSLKNILELKRKSYINIEGLVQVEYVHKKRDWKSGTTYITNLSIPPYFDNMDEIYQSLTQFKQQTTEKSEHLSQTSAHS